MIHYDPGSWSILFAFSCKGSVFPKAMVWALPCATVSMLLHTVFQRDPQISSKMGTGDVGASVLAGFTFVFGFLVVFRSQQAYSRWWEGGTLLQQLRGEWFNAFSSLLAFCNNDRGKEEDVLAFQHQLCRLCSLLYCTALQQVSTMKDKNFEVFDIEDFDGETMRYMLQAPDRCEVCLQWIQRLIGDANEKQIIKVAPPILSRVFNQLGNGIVMLNNARKIKDFPIPFPLAQMITFMLLMHWVITAWVCACSVERVYWAGILSFIVTFSFWGITYIAVELEQPFGDDNNDLPLHKMQIDMNSSLQALLDVRAQRAPKYTFKKEHTMLSRASENIDILFQSTKGSIPGSTPNAVSMMPDVLVTGASSDVVPGAILHQSQGAAEPFAQPKLVGNVIHAASPPLQEEYHGKWTAFPKQDTFPEALPGRSQAGTPSWETPLHFGVKDHNSASVQPCVEEFEEFAGRPRQVIKLATALPPDINDGVHTQRSLSSGSGGNDAMPSRTVTTLPDKDYTETHARLGATANAGGTKQAATVGGVRHTEV